MPAKPKLVIYGVKNCDTIRKARAWLDARGAAYAFHDYKALGAPKAKLAAWAKQVGWETLLNRAGTTFRALPEADKTGLNQNKVLALMGAQPSLIKRPVLEWPGGLLVGFTPDQYDKALAAVLG